MGSIMCGVTAADYICYLGTNASGNVITVGATQVEDNANDALDLPAGHEEIAYDQQVPAWAATSLSVMAQNGVELTAEAPLTRAQAAQILYQTSRMAIGAPGMMVFNMQD